MRSRVTWNKNQDRLEVCSFIYVLLYSCVDLVLGLSLCVYMSVFHIYPYVKVCQFMWQFKCLHPCVCVCVCVSGQEGGRARAVVVVRQALLSPQLWCDQYQQTRLALSWECKSMSGNTQLFTHQAANTPHRHASLLINNTHNSRRPLLHASSVFVCVCVCVCVCVLVLKLNYFDILSRRKVFTIPQWVVRCPGIHLGGHHM